METQSPTTIQVLAVALLGLAIVHTFATTAFKKFASRYPEGSIGENAFHLLGEVEVVFGFWAGIFLLSYMAIEGSKSAVAYAESLNFTEPLFVFAIMTVAATRPILEVAGMLIRGIARLIPMHREMATYFSCLLIGPLLGSFITEPAAMTVTALLLRDRYYSQGMSSRFMYLTLGVLFVNISIGGAMTPYAAPPVLMVAAKWNWDLAFMISTFAYKVTVACVINALMATFLLGPELRRVTPSGSTTIRSRPVPFGLSMIHVGFLGVIVVFSHHPVIFMGAFLYFLGIVAITTEYQTELKLKESLLVAFFLAGLVLLGGLQGWWLQPILLSMGENLLFVGTTALTAITDNAALTYLGSQVEGPSAEFQYALVAGAIAGGGLTVIANAPNPAGFSILQDKFGEGGINPLKLFVAAAVPTLVGMACLWLLP